jgi:dienelactone hydrolase
MSIWNTEALFSEVRYRVVETEGPVRSVFFRNEPYRGKPTEVFAFVGVPEAVQRPLPGMVCVHGGGGKAFKYWVQMWVARGYAAIAMDLTGCGADGKPHAAAGPPQEHDLIFNTTSASADLWPYHAVAAVIRANSLLRGLAEVDEGRVGMTGISWGGYLACITAGVDTRLGCAIPVYGCGMLQNNSAEDWMKDFDGMTPAQRRAWHDKWDPSVYLKATSVPMLFVSGTNDFAYPLDSLEMSCALPRGEVARCVRVEMGHGHDHGWAPAEIALFADHHLAGGDALPSLGPCERMDGGVSARFASCRPVRNGYLLYTCCRGRWQDRKWHTGEAEIEGGAVQARLPRGVSVCYLAVEDDRGAYVSSSCVEIETREEG